MGLRSALQEIIGPKIFRHKVTFDKDVNIGGNIFGPSGKVYDTGWINRSDWTNVHLGSDTTKNIDSNITHNLNASLSQLMWKILISTDGTDANGFEIASNFISSTTVRICGITVYQINNNNIKVQTGTEGIAAISDTGTIVIIDTEDWYYKVKVWYLG